MTYGIVCKHSWSLLSVYTYGAIIQGLQICSWLGELFSYTTFILLDDQSILETCTWPLWHIISILKSSKYGILVHMET